jgi:thiamine-phosphate pyrophosphorylase
MFSSHSKHFAAGPPPLPARANQPTGPPIVCYVTDRKALAGDKSLPALLDVIRAIAAAGVDWVQIREKDLPARDLFTLVKEAVALASVRSGSIRARSIKVIVNDRLDVALAAGAAGVHLGHASAPAREVVRWCRAGNAPADFFIGVSCHSLEGAQDAESAGASYTYFGPIYETPSKIPFGKPHGIEELAQIASAVTIPVIAIGGVNASNAPECLRAKAAGIAAIRLFQNTFDSAALTKTIQTLHNLPLEM